MQELTMKPAIKRTVKPAKRQNRTNTPRMANHAFGNVLAKRKMLLDTNLMKVLLITLLSSKTRTDLGALDTN